MIVARPPLKVRLFNDDFNPFNGSSLGGRHEGAQAVQATERLRSPGYWCAVRVLVRRQQRSGFT